MGFLVCLWCPDMKPLVVFPDWLDWCWRHMALIRLFNLSPVTMPRISRLIEFADGLSWYKTFERHFFNYLCMFCPLQQMCVYVCVFLFVSVCERVVGLWLGAPIYDKNCYVDVNISCFLSSDEHWTVMFILKWIIIKEKNIFSLQ